MFVDLLFPRRCVGCGRTGEYFCPSCWEKVSLHKIQWCPKCRYPSIFGKLHPWCRDEVLLKGAISLFPYEGVIEKAIKKLKYRLVTDMVEELAGKVFEKTKRESPAFFRYLSRDFVLVPVPLHFWKQNQRGFNQAEVLGRALAARFGWRVEARWLRRKKMTKMQSKLKREERLKNVARAFCLVTPDISLSRNPDLLLFDDVWTSGSTLRECARVLKKAGARNIYTLTLAR